VTLFCNTCHTKWTEACLDVYDRCPFTDCGGRLTLKPPKDKQKKQRSVRQVDVLPLLRKAGLPT